MLIFPAIEAKQGEMAKMVRLEDDVHERLTNEGGKKESYSAIIKRLLEELDEYRNSAREQK